MMSFEELLSTLSGGQSIVEWFGKIPHFHDAEILELNLALGDACSMKIHAWNVTDAVDEKGFFKTEKHAVVVISFAAIQTIQLEDFDLNSIVFNLEFKGSPTQTEISWTSSYGAAGRIVGGGVNFTIVPGKP